MKNLLIVMLLVFGWSMSPSFMWRKFPPNIVKCKHNSQAMVCRKGRSVKIIIRENPNKIVLFNAR
jgi:hypothetical protein